MPVFTAQQLANWTAGTWMPRAPEAVAGFHFDTRQLRPGDLFIALRTDKRDGHAFVATAAAHGAAAALVSTPQPVNLPQLVVADPLAALQAIARAHRAAWPHPVVGITGSVGKTSTKDLLTHLLGRASTAATPGNFNNHLGVPLSILRADPTVHDRLVLEAGTNHPGEIAALAALIQPQVAIVTAVGAAHLEFLHNLDGVAEEKADLCHASPPPRLCLFPEELRAYAPFRHTAPAWTVALGDGPAGPGRVAYQTTDQAENNRPAVVPEVRTGIRVDVGELFRNDQTLPVPTGAVGLTIWLPPEAGSKVIRTCLQSTSSGMARNAALAAAAAVALGVPAAVVAERLATWSPLADRGAWRTSALGRPYYVDCYNANPLSFADALAAFHRRCPQAPRTFVLGGMFELGAEAAQWHAWVAERVPTLPGDHVILVGAGAPAYAPVLSERPGVQLHLVASAEDAAPFLAAGHEPVFLKGGHAARLESLAPASSEEVCVC